MAVKKEIIDGTKIINEIESTNIVRTEYDTETKKLVTEFHINEKINDIAFLNNYSLYAVAQKRNLYIYDDKG